VLRRAGRALDFANRGYGGLADAIAGAGARSRRVLCELSTQRNGLCCSFADGYVVEDADWDTTNGHDRVRVPKSPDSKIMV
jgi:hypothetical protein